MKLLLIALLTSGASAQMLGLADSVHPTFKRWMDEHGVGFDTRTKTLDAQHQFFKNQALIEQLNADEHDTAEYGLNRFSHMSPEQFKEQMLLKGHGQPVRPNMKSSQPPSLKDVPSEWDWRDKNAVTSVKDQGALGTCWIFSTMGNLEGQRALGGDDLVDLSVEHVLECDAGTDDVTGNADCGMFGGWPYLAYEGIIARGGVFADSDMPYCAGISYGKDGNCMPCMADNYDEELCGNHSDDDGGLPLYCEPESTLGQGTEALCKGESDDYKYAMTISNWTDVSSTSADEIAASLVEIGPLSVALDASKLQFYKGGVFNPSKCSETALNHAVLLVGFGTDDTDGDYFTVKNSWAEKWGEDGYFRIAKADGAGTCGINTAVTSGLV